MNAESTSSRTSNFCCVFQIKKKEDPKFFRYFKQKFGIVYYFNKSRCKDIFVLSEGHFCEEAILVR